MRKLTALLALIFITNASPALADAQLDADRETLTKLQMADARLHTIGWALATGNAAFCDVTQPSVGLLLQDMAAFKSADRMRAAANVITDITVQAVAPELPAAKLGMAPNMSIYALDGTDLRTLPTPEVGYERLAKLNDLTEAALKRDGYLNITWRESPFGAITAKSLFGKPACVGRFEMLTNSKRASADGQRVLIGTQFAGIAYADEEFAAAVAHEFAHNLLGHRAMLDASPRQISTRASEREADRLMPWLLANAGYDPAAALRFMQRWGPKHDGGILRARSHDGWDERADNIAAELPLIAASIEKHGAADWSEDFLR